MSDPIVTLTTDFGEDSPYVAAVKGVVLAVNPAARLVDLSHQIPPQDIVHAAVFLASAIPFFPSGVIHVVVVDPGVGTERDLLYIEADGHRLLAPDNGCWTLLPAASVVRRLGEPAYWRPEVSATFHGRDILAPVAGWLSRGLDPDVLGPAVTTWERLELPPVRREGDGVRGEVILVDHFGNLITNIPGAALGPPGGQPMLVRVGTAPVERRVRTYGEAEPGALVALVSSGGYLEIAVARGSAAERLKARRGTPVVLGGS
jgi:S-adenosylmethionine hydrolase